jgi:radical SAM superfamily enzyme YgiQ (UPF0313 family)
MPARACNALLIYPRFGADTFWSFAATCEVFGARYPAAPLGLITVAALLPSTWCIRLVDRNAEELTDGDLEWADLVMTGGMLPQLSDLIDIIDLCRARQKPVAIGGPAVTSSPHFFRKANFRVLGEAEGIIDKFLEAWEAGARGRFRGREVPGGRDEKSDSAFRPAQVRTLPPHRRAVLSRLSLHLRVL